jgi:four helix bundle protein
MGDFRKLVAWQKAHVFSVALHNAFRARDPRAFTGLRGQIMRSAGSVADNLVEGCARESQADFRRYANDAYSSAKEAQGQLLRARDIGVLAPGAYVELSDQLDEVCRLCWTLSRRKR